MKEKGLSLIEALITLSVIAVIALFARPQLLELDSYRTQTRAYSISSLFGAGNNISLAAAAEVILCPSNNDRDCVNSWNASNWIVFLNSNGNSRRETDEPLLRRLPPDANTRVRFNGAVPRFLRWYATGHINRAFSLTICPASGKAERARVLIVNLQGRVREGVDEDGDGLVEQADGSNATCQG